MFMFATAADVLAGCELTAAPLLTKRHCAVYVLAFQDAASLFIRKIAPFNVLLRYTNERGVGLSFGQLPIWLRAAGEADVGNKCRKLWPSLRTLKVSVSVFF